MKNFKNISHKVAYCGIICALSIMIMMVSIVPGFTYAVPAVSGIIIWSVSIFISFKWALLSFTASALLCVLMVPEPEAKTVFIVFFGYYPIIRSKLFLFKTMIVKFLIKFLIFNISCITAFQILKILIGLEKVLEGMEFMGDYAVYGFWVAANIAFICYEICLTQLHYVMEKWIKPKFFKRMNK